MMVDSGHSSAPMRRRTQRATQETTVPVVPASSTPMPAFAMRLLALQRQAGNRAVADALNTPIALQRVEIGRASCRERVL